MADTSVSKSAKMEETKPMDSTVKEEDLSEKDVSEQEKLETIINEDEKWKIPTEYLMTSCLKVLAENIMDIGFNKVKCYLSERRFQQFLNLLPLDLPEEYALFTIENNNYWKRRCENHWSLCDEYKHGSDYRRMYAERKVNEAIENYNSQFNSFQEILSFIEVYKDFVINLEIKQLNIEQILPIEREKIEEDVEEVDEDDYFERPPSYSASNHIDVGKILVNFPHLEEISLNLCPGICGLDFEYEKCIFTVQDAKRLATAVETINTLKTLRLYGTVMSLTHVNILFDALQNHPILSHLDLSHNLMVDECGIPLAKLLLSLCPLKVLKLGYNSINDKGIKALGCALTKNTNLRTLDLKLNRITDESACFLFQCIENNSTLKNLILSGNKLGHEAGLKMANLIEKSTSLHIVDVSGNLLGHEIGTVLSKALEKNFVLRKLDIRICEIGVENEVAISELEMRNYLLRPGMI